MLSFAVFLTTKSIQILPSTINAVSVDFLSDFCVGVHRHEYYTNQPRQKILRNVSEADHVPRLVFEEKVQECLAKDETIKVGGGAHEREGYWYKVGEGLIKGRGRGIR